MAFKLEKNVPIPAIEAHRRLPKRESKYPFSKMEVGDSFMVAHNKKEARIPYSKEGKPRPSLVQVAAYAFAKKKGVKFTVRRDPQGNIRIWRKE